MADKMLIDASHAEETRVVVVRGNRIEEFDFESQHKRQLRGNIYLAKVTRVEPSLQAAFIDYGGNRHGFLAFSEIHPDYYQIPLADRQALIAAEAEAEAERARHENDADEAAEEAEGDDDGSDNGDGDGDGGRDHPRAERGGKRRGRGRRRGQESRSSEDDDEDEAPETINADIDGDEVSEDVPPQGKAETGTQALAQDPERDPGLVDFDAAQHVEGIAPADPTPPADSSFETEASDGGAGDVEVNETGEDNDAASAGGELDTTAELVTSGGASRQRDRGGRRQETARKDKADEADPVESVGAEDALEELPERSVSRKPRKQYRIQEVIKRRQILLVQVVKEERGNKGAALTTYLSLAGRYSVLMPNTARGGGISRKITNVVDRKRLKEVARGLEVPQGMGVILRTAGANRTKAEVKRDFEYLMRLWENVRNLTLASTAPCLVYEEGSLIKRSIRDLYNKDISEIIVSGEEGYREAKDFMKMLMPSHAKVVQPYRDIHPIFARTGIEAQLDKMLQPQVTLKSGGYIIINQTEALVAIDVNSGRSTKEHSIEDTALHTNLEAATEVARQLRLRDLAGLIVIDFIDMEEKRNNRAVEKKLKEALKDDRARIQVGRISHFGLLEMSRQRIRASVLESTTQVCEHCGGTGHVRSQSSVALHVLRGIEEFLLKSTTHNITVRMMPDTALYVLNQKRDSIVDMERRFGVSIIIEADASIGSTHLAIDRGSAVEVPVKIENIIQADQYPEDDDDDVPISFDEDEEEEDDVKAAAPLPKPARASGDDNDNGENGQRKRKRRRRRRGGRDTDAQGDEGSASPANEAHAGDDHDDDDQDGEDAGNDASIASDDDDNRPKKRRRRGKRGGRRNRADEATAESDGQVEADGETGGLTGDVAGVEDAGDEIDDVDAVDQQAVAAVEASADESVAEASTAEVDAAVADLDGGTADADPVEKPKRRRAPRRKKDEAAADAAAETPAPDAEAAESEPPAKPKRSRARAKPKTDIEPVIDAGETAASGDAQAAAPIAETDRAVEEPAVEAVAPREAEPETAAAAVSSEPIVSSTSSDADQDAKPKKAGWWQRRGFF
jgi:ribonuclease E